MEVHNVDDVVHELTIVILSSDADSRSQWSEARFARTVELGTDLVDAQKESFDVNIEAEGPLVIVTHVGDDPEAKTVTYYQTHEADRYCFRVEIWGNLGRDGTTVVPEILPWRCDDL